MLKAIRSIPIDPEGRFLSLIAVLYILLRLLIYKNVDLLLGHWDAVTRIYFAYEMGNNFNYILPSTTWLPLHFYINYLFTWLNSPHIYIFLSALYTFLANIFIYKIAKINWGEWVARCTLVLLTFMSINIQMSLTVLAEPMFNLFLVASLYYFLKWFKFDASPWPFILTLNIANFIKFELWPFTGVLFFVYIFRKGFNKNSLPALCLFGTIIIYFGLCYFISGNALIAFTEHVTDTGEFNGRTGYHPMKVLGSYFKFYFENFFIFTPLIFLGIWKSIKEKEPILIWYFSLFIIFTSMVAMQVLMPFHRYFFSIISILTPLVFIPLLKLEIKARKILFFILLIPTILFFQIKKPQYNSIDFNASYRSPDNFYNKMSKVFNYIHENQLFNEVFMFDEFEYAREFVQIYSNTFNKSNIILLDEENRNDRLILKDKFFAHLKRKQARYILKFPNASMESQLQAKETSLEEYGYISVMKDEYLELFKLVE